MADVERIMPNRIKEFRARFKINQARLAEKIGVSQQTIARWESGKSDVPMSSLRKIAAAYGISVSDLIYLDDEVTKSLKKVERSRDVIWPYSDITHDAPWGELYLRLNGFSEELSYPVDYMTVDTFKDVMVDYDSEFGMFEGFTTLDNKLVYVNVNEIQEVRFEDDALQEMSAYHHQDVYKLLEEMDYDSSIDSLKDYGDSVAEEFSDPDYRYSVSDIITIVTKYGITFRLPATEKTIDSIMTGILGKTYKFIVIDDFDEERIVHTSQIVYLHMPLIKYKIQAAKYDLENGEYLF